MQIAHVADDARREGAIMARTFSSILLGILCLVPSLASAGTGDAPATPGTLKALANTPLAKTVSQYLRVRSVEERHREITGIGDPKNLLYDSVWMASQPIDHGKGLYAYGFRPWGKLARLFHASSGRFLNKYQERNCLMKGGPFQPNRFVPQGGLSSVKKDLAPEMHMTGSCAG